MNKSVLIIIPKLGSGGAERQAVTVARLLAKVGCHVSFLTYFSGDFFKELLDEAGVHYMSEVCGGLKRIVMVRRKIKEGNYDVVISFMQTPNFLNNFAAIGKHSWKVISSIRATPQKEEFLSLQGRIYGWFYRISNVIVTNSQNTSNVFSSFFPRYQSKLSTIYNAVQLGEIKSNYIAKINNRLNVVVAATISKVKNPMGLLEALELMSEEEKALIHIDWYGKSESVIGDHSEYDKVIERIGKSNLGNVISMPGESRSIADIMYKADCVALFSKREGLPNAICEAMMIGKPIIMTKCSDFSVLVEENKNGFLCNWDEPASIKNALLKLAILDKDDLIKMGDSSRDKAAKLFSQEAITKQWVTLINGNE